MTRGWQALTKVPRINGLFWVIKILTTGMGEATSDFLAHRFNPFVAGAVGGIALVIALIWQFRTPRYWPWPYWTCVAMVAVFGTMAADGLHIELHVPYIDSTIFYALALTIIFVIWKKSEKTLSIHSIHTPRREAFYWATVLATFALGTAAGDFSAINLNLGYFSSGLFFAGLFAVPALGYWWFKRNPVFSFWFAYIITRPLGASFADWSGVPRSIGGLGYGRGLTALGSAAVILVLVWYLALTHKDAEHRFSTDH